ncbi:PspA/IM30 family protein [Roseibium salinum]|uniref:PspA/IM30 family protein n=1 Tax=Roseibium salinum TaxID=1604349 RepID=UPI00361760F6
MAEGLVARVKRLVSGGFNQVVDSIESASPETVMAEAIREVDRATDQVRDELAGVLANKHLANTRLGTTTTRHEELQEQIVLAVKQGRDDLAEAAIARQLDLEVQIPVLESAVADAGRDERSWKATSVRFRPASARWKLNSIISAARSSRPRPTAPRPVRPQKATVPRARPARRKTPSIAS